MSREMELQFELLSAQIRRLERALAELASESHAVSRPQQMANKGYLALAEIVRDHRVGRLETVTSLPTEQR